MKRFYLPALIVVMFITAFTFFQTVNANPSSFLTPVSTSTDEATTTVAYISAGLSTTTLVYDAFQLGNSTTLIPRAADQASLIYWMNATNTTSELNINIQYSPGRVGVDCKALPTGCDWYQDRGTMGVNTATTSAPTFSLFGVTQFNHVFASSTPELIANATNASTTGIILLKTPMRYTRAIFTVPIGAANVGVWAAFVPVRENSE